jgi:hypothetical protein
MFSTAKKKGVCGLNTYKIKKVAEGKEIDWEGIPQADIANYSPQPNGYYPKAYAKLCHDGKAVHVLFHVEEPSILATFRNYNDPVSENSCCEFFLSAYPDLREDYMNFEVSALGTLLLGFGYVRPGRGRLWQFPPETFSIQSTVKDPAAYNGKFWEVRYTIPFAVINEAYGAAGLGSFSRIRGNFYTICSKGELQHSGTWNPTPAFHDRTNFGYLILE